MFDVSLVPLPITCPKCRYKGYMKRLIGENVGKMNVKCINCNSYFSLDELKQPLIEEPALTPDFVKVVRCKECKHWGDDGHCDAIGIWIRGSGDFFCSRGERK